MTQEPEPTGDRLAQLTEVARQLLSEINGLTEKSGEQFVSLARRARDNRRMIWAAIVLTVATGLGLFQVTINAAHIDDLTQRLDVAQTTQRQKALCPLYQVLLDLKSPQGRERAPDPVKYDHAFAVMEDGYQVLNCAEFNADGKEQ
jgi:hypothetical protein